MRDNVFRNCNNSPFLFEPPEEKKTHQDVMFHFECLRNTFHLSLLLSFHKHDGMRRLHLILLQNVFQKMCSKSKIAKKKRFYLSTDL